MNAKTGSHGGDPDLLPLLVIDAPELQVKDPDTPDSNVLLASSDFQVALVFEFSGTLAGVLMGSALTYTITYTFNGRPGAPDGPTLTRTGTTAPGKFRYGSPETEITVPAGSLKPGLYELAAAVTFADPSGAPAPIAAFAEVPLVHVF